MDTGRNVLFAIVIAAMVATVLGVLWVGQDGALGTQSKQRAIAGLLSIYAPLLSVMAGFYFAQHQGTEGATAKAKTGALPFAVIVTVIWCVAPVFAYLGSKNIDEAILLFETLRPFGDFVACGATTFYFANR